MGHRYGTLIMTLPEGRWFWTGPLECCDFVPIKRHTSTITLHIRRRSDNTPEGALRTVCRHILRESR